MFTADHPLLSHPEASAAAPAVSLDIERLERAGHLVPTKGRSVQSEEFRRIKQQLLAHVRSTEAGADRLSLIGVTSALPGEGKTSTAINLALSMSTEIDTSVLLVDADVLRPDVMRRLGMEAQPGLLDLLATPSMNVWEVVLRTNIPKLSILSAGHCRENSAELLTSAAMERLLDTLLLAGRERVILFDAPPLLLSTEAGALARLMGQVVVVVEASRTPRSAVTQAFAALEDCPNVYALLNKAAQAPTYGYGDYYS